MWLPWANVPNYSTFHIFSPVYCFIWAYGTLLHALPLPARSYALLELSIVVQSVTKAICEACSYDSLAIQ